jgi:hypothetical protein
MQMISRDKLLKLMSKPDGLLDEAERNNAVSYKEFLKVSHIALNKARKEDEDDAEYIACESLKNGWIKEHCPPVRYLGEGSSRLAMAIDGGKCLKIASNDEGIEQNENEIAVLQNGEGFSCFPKLHDYDRKKKFSIVVDCCCEAKPSDFMKNYGISCNLAVGTVWQLVKDCLDFSKTSAYFTECMSDSRLAALDEYENFDKRLAFLERLEKSKDNECAWTSMWDLARFCDSHRGMLELFDLESEVNWGMLGRDGKLCPVVIDAGI